MSTPADEKTPAISSVTLSDADEKDNKIPKEQTDSLDEPHYDFDSEEFSSIPDLVRNVVSFEDDPTLPTITFRSVLLAAVFCVIGSIVSQLSLSVILLESPTDSNRDSFGLQHEDVDCSMNCGILAGHLLTLACFSFRTTVGCNRSTDTLTCEYQLT